MTCNRCGLLVGVADVADGCRVLDARRGGRHRRMGGRCRRASGPIGGAPRGRAMARCVRRCSGAEAVIWGYFPRPEGDALFVCGSSPRDSGTFAMMPRRSSSQDTNPFQAFRRAADDTTAVGGGECAGAAMATTTMRRCSCSRGPRKRVAAQSPPRGPPSGAH